MEPDQNKNKPKPAILFAHAAFHRPSHYERVLGALRDDMGFTVVAPALPTTASEDPGQDPRGLGRADDTAVLNGALEPLLAAGREVVVVAHDFGALPASHCVEGESVAERAECGLRGGVARYVNVCGLSYAERGRDIIGKMEDFPLQEYHQVDDGLIRLLDTARPVFYSDLTPEQVDEIWPSVVKTHSLKNYNSFPDFVDKEMSIPKTYVLCEDDMALAVEYQAFFIGNGGYEDVIRLPSGHFPFLSMPERMIEIISEIASRD